MHPAPIPAGRINLIRDELTSTGEIIHQTDLGFDALDRIINEVTAPEPVGLLVESAIMTYDADNRMLTTG